MPRPRNHPNGLGRMEDLQQKQQREERLRQLEAHQQQQLHLQAVPSGSSSQKLLQHEIRSAHANSPGQQHGLLPTSYGQHIDMSCESPLEELHQQHHSGTACLKKHSRSPVSISIQNCVDDGKGVLQAGCAAADVRNNTADLDANSLPLHSEVKSYDILCCERPPRVENNLHRGNCELLAYGLSNAPHNCTSDTELESAYPYPESKFTEDCDEQAELSISSDDNESVVSAGDPIDIENSDSASDDSHQPVGKTRLAARLIRKRRRMAAEQAPFVIDNNAILQDDTYEGSDSDGLNSSSDDMSFDEQQRNVVDQTPSPHDCVSNSQFLHRAWSTHPTKRNRYGAYHRSHSTIHGFNLNMPPEDAVKVLNPFGDQCFKWNVDPDALLQSVECLQSPVFQAAGYDWQLQIKKSGPKDNPALGIWIELVSELEPFQSAGVKFEFAWLAPILRAELRTDFKDDSVPMLTKEGRGWHRIIDSGEMPEWIHPDGTLKVHCRVTKVHDLVKPVYEFKNYNSKKATGFVGLQNQGATCYMNSFLQALYHILQFRQAVYLLPVPTELHVKPCNPISYALQKLFYELQTAQQSVSTKQLTESFGWTSAESFMQHDVQEFSRVLMDNLESQMANTAVDGVISRLFEGRLESYIQCLNVDFTSSRQEPFLDLALNVKGCPNLHKSFENFVEEERLEGENQYRAGQFGKQDARKGTRFLTLPPILQLQLKRFEYDPLQDALTKVNDRFEFPTELDLSFMLSSRDSGDMSTSTSAELSTRTNYHLHSVLIHSGSVHGGHYYSFIRPFTNAAPAQSKWIRFDDEIVHHVTQNDAVDANFGGETEFGHKTVGSYVRHERRAKTASAYMLIYVRETHIPYYNPVAIYDSVYKSPQQQPPYSSASNIATRPSQAMLSSHSLPLNCVDTVELMGGISCAQDQCDNVKSLLSQTAVISKVTQHSASELRNIEVMLPDNLSARFAAEHEAALLRQRQAQEDAKFVSMGIINSRSLMGRLAAHDYCSVAHHSMTNYITRLDFIPLRVLRMHTLDDLSDVLYQQTGIPADDQLYMRYVSRETQDQRPHAPALPKLPIQTVFDSNKPILLLHDLRLDRYLNTISSEAGRYIRNVTSCVDSLQASQKQIESLEHRFAFLGFKYFDVLTQQIYHLFSSYFPCTTQIGELKCMLGNYIRECQRIQATAGFQISHDEQSAIDHSPIFDFSPLTLKDPLVAAKLYSLSQVCDVSTVQFERMQLWEEVCCNYKIISFTPLTTDTNNLEDCRLQPGDIIVFQCADSKQPASINATAQSSTALALQNTYAHLADFERQELVKALNTPWFSTADHLMTWRAKLINIHFTHISGREHHVIQLHCLKHALHALCALGHLLRLANPFRLQLYDAVSAPVELKFSKPLGWNDLNMALSQRIRNPDDPTVYFLYEECSFTPFQLSMHMLFHMIFVDEDFQETSFSVLVPRSGNNRCDALYFEASATLLDMLPLRVYFSISEECAHVYIAARPHFFRINMVDGRKVVTIEPDVPLIDVYRHLENYRQQCLLRFEPVPSDLVPLGSPSESNTQRKIAWVQLFKPLGPKSTAFRTTSPIFFVVVEQDSSMSTLLDAVVCRLSLPKRMLSQLRLAKLNDHKFHWIDLKPSVPKLANNDHMVSMSTTDMETISNVPASELKDVRSISIAEPSIEPMETDMPAEHDHVLDHLLLQENGINFIFGVTGPELTFPRRHASSIDTYVSNSRNVMHVQHGVKIG